ncbi:MAG: porin [Proteobacteria bacterium]|nr:porin [Pseudomonadota bacterium]
MKKIFISSALALALLSGSSFASTKEEPSTVGTTAQAPSLNIHGFSTFNTYFYNQQRRENGKGGPQPHMALDASDLYFTISGKTINGIEYKYRVNLQALPGADPYINSNYIEFSGQFGTFQLGNVVGPEDRLVYDASRLVGATGIFDGGGLFNIINPSAGIFRGNDNIGDTGNATKIAWYSPEVMGFQVGVAYTPNTARQGDDKLQNSISNNSNAPGNNGGVWPVKDHRPYGLRNVAVGIVYNTVVDKWRLTLSAAGISEKSYFTNLDGSTEAQHRVSLRNAAGYQLGAIVGYKSAQFGVGWLDNGKSRLPRDKAVTINKVSNALGDYYLGTAGQAWNVGASYSMGAYQFSAAYQKTSRKTDLTNKASSDIYGISVDVAALTGLAIYGEVDYVSMKTNQAAVNVYKGLSSGTKMNDRAVGDNSGTVFIMGTKVSF